MYNLCITLHVYYILTNEKINSMWVNENEWLPKCFAKDTY